MSKQYDLRLIDDIDFDHLLELWEKNIVAQKFFKTFSSRERSRKKITLEGVRQALLKETSYIANDSALTFFFKELEGSGCGSWNEVRHTFEWKYRSARISQLLLAFV